MSLTIRRLFAAMLLLADVFSSAFAQVATVDVKGEGDSFYAAQIDASRQALMLVLPQIVSVDRQVINDNVKETILSSANGYIENFQIVKEAKVNGVVRLDARVTVSTNAIEQFNSMRRPNNGMSLSGSSILAEINREKVQSEFLDNFMTRAFSGMPNAAMELKILKTEKHPTIHGVVRMQIQGRLRPEFMKALESSVSSIACKMDTPRKDCVFEVKLFKGYIRTPTFFGGERISEDWAIFKLPKNIPFGYHAVDFMTRSDQRSTNNPIRWSTVGRILFFDTNKRLIKDVQNPGFFAGLEFDYWLPLEGDGCAERKQNCQLIISSRPFLIDLEFTPESFGEDFSKVASMEVRSYLNRRVGVNYNKPVAISNIVCNQVSDYLKLHHIPDHNLYAKDIVKGCQLGYFHAQERKVPVQQYYPE